MAERKTRGVAIREFCLLCVGGSATEVKLCTAPDCPLYRYRLGKEQSDDAPKKQRKGGKNEK